MGIEPTTLAPFPRFTERLDSNKELKKSKCFIWCRIEAREPLFLSLSCTEFVPNSQSTQCCIVSHLLSCFIPFVPPIRCFVHVASNSGETTDPSVFGKGKFRKKSREELPPPEVGHTSQHKRVTNQKDEPIISGLLVIRPESAISSGSFFDTMVSAEFAVECRLF